jgi:hypothetical protein
MQRGYGIGVDEPDYDSLDEYSVSTDRGSVGGFVLIGENPPSPPLDPDYGGFLLVCFKKC